MEGVVAAAVMPRLLLFLLLARIAASDVGLKKVTGADDGPHMCGGQEIPYPFGIGEGSYRDDGFKIVCRAGGMPALATTSDDGVDGDDAFIPISNLSIVNAEAVVMLPVRSQCYNTTTGNVSDSGFTDLKFSEQGVYRISDKGNHLYVLGCNTVGYLRSKEKKTKGDGNNGTYYSQLIGCLSYCADSDSPKNGSCAGVGCCRADIPNDLVDNVLDFDRANRTDEYSFGTCDYAFLVEQGRYDFTRADLSMDHRREMPVRLDWAIRDNETCAQAQAQAKAQAQDKAQAQANKASSYACVSSDSICIDSVNGPGYICRCRDGYEGNPYIDGQGGCVNIDECQHPDKYPCKANCKDNPKGGYTCTCPRGKRSPDPYKEACVILPNSAWVIIGSIAGLFIIAILVFLGMLHKEKKRMQDFFKKNGGPILAKVNNIKLYKMEDLKEILKSSNVIGKGGFGMVYKGIIGDSNQLVAVKKPINVNLADKDQFANEIIIQSRVIHRNIVNLIGCCLEVDIPILVYEFLPKGSLHDILHGSHRVPLDLNLRLQIATESAEGLAYMHSKTANTILHGDVKPANILLDDEFVPKISDFGISRLIATNEKHTINVIGDKSYMDPVYLQTGLLTNKSDVYSFGVVLLELITRKKASHADNNSLLRNFLDAYKNNNSVIELLDKELVEVVDDLELLDGLAGMIKQCLNLDVDQRPEMNDLVDQLRNMEKRSKRK